MNTGCNRAYSYQEENKSEAACCLNPPTPSGFAFSRTKTVTSGISTIKCAGFLMGWFNVPIFDRLAAYYLGKSWYVDLFRGGHKKTSERQLMRSLAAIGTQEVQITPKLIYLKSLPRLRSTTYSNSWLPSIYFWLAPRHGFEPRLGESKSPVLNHYTIREKDYRAILSQTQQILRWLSPTTSAESFLSPNLALIWS